MQIYLVLPYYSYEGYASPIKAFFNQEQAEIFVKKVNEWLEREPHLTSDEYDAWQEEIGMEEVPTSADGYEIKTLVVE